MGEIVGTCAGDEEVGVLVVGDIVGKGVEERPNVRYPKCFAWVAEQETQPASATLCLLLKHLGAGYVDLKGTGCTLVGWPLDRAAEEAVLKKCVLAA